MGGERREGMGTRESAEKRDGGREQDREREKAIDGVGWGGRERESDTVLPGSHPVTGRIDQASVERKPSFTGIAL